MAEVAMTYENHCKQVCEWCAKGVPRVSAFWEHTLDTGLLPTRHEYKRPCTSPTPEAWGAATIADLRARLAEAEQELKIAQDESWENWNSFQRARNERDRYRKALEEMPHANNCGINAPCSGCFYGECDEVHVRSCSCPKRILTESVKETE